MEQFRVQKSITVTQIVKFLAFCGSRRFIVVFTRVRLLPLSWTDQSNPRTPILLFGTFFHIPFSSSLQSSKCLFLSDFFIKHFMSFSYYLLHVSHAPIHILYIIKAPRKKIELVISVSKIKMTDYQLYGNHPVVWPEDGCNAGETCSHEPLIL